MLLRIGINWANVEDIKPALLVILGMVYLLLLVLGTGGLKMYIEGLVKAKRAGSEPESLREFLYDKTLGMTLFLTLCFSTAVLTYSGAVFWILYKSLKFFFWIPE